MKGIGIEVRENESIERAIRRFRKLCEKNGIISDVKKNRHYIKPSEKRRLRKKRAIRKQKSMNQDQ